MIKVQLKNGVNIDRALKILKNKVAKTKQLKELRDRQAYVKPSDKRREEIKKAIYIQNLKQQDQDNN